MSTEDWGWSEIPRRLPGETKGERRFRIGGIRFERWVAERGHTYCVKHRQLVRTGDSEDHCHRCWREGDWPWSEGETSGPTPRAGWQAKFL